MSNHACGKCRRCEAMMTVGSRDAWRDWIKRKPGGFSSLGE